MCDYGEIREQCEKEGYIVSDMEYERLLRYAKRKTESAGKGESYLPYLLPDVIKDHCIRVAINAITVEAMEVAKI